MRDDIVERLAPAGVGLCSEDPYQYMARHISAGDCIEAAGEIERLRREVERLNARTLTRPWGD